MFWFLCEAGYIGFLWYCGFPLFILFPLVICTYVVVIKVWCALDDCDVARVELF